MFSMGNSSQANGFIVFYLKMVMLDRRDDQGLRTNSDPFCEEMNDIGQSFSSFTLAQWQVIEKDFECP